MDTCPCTPLCKKYCIRWKCCDKKYKTFIEVCDGKTGPTGSTGNSITGPPGPTGNLGPTGPSSQQTSVQLVGLGEHFFLNQGSGNLQFRGLISPNNSLIVTPTSTDLELTDY